MNTAGLLIQRTEDNPFYNVPAKGYDLHQTMQSDETHTQ